MKGVREHLSEVVDLRQTWIRMMSYCMTIQGIPILQMRSLSLGRGLNMARICSE